MVNPSAARHLALVVGVLLCFFVYMGYHIKTKRAQEAEDAVHGLQTAAIPNVSADSFSLLAAADGGSRDNPTTPPAGASLPLGDLAIPADDGDDAFSASLSDGLLAMADSAATSVSGTPSGSFEESGLADADVITGLTAAPSQDVPAQPGEMSFLNDVPTGTASTAPREPVPAGALDETPASLFEAADSMPVANPAPANFTNAAPVGPIGLERSTPTAALPTPPASAPATAPARNDSPPTATPPPPGREPAPGSARGDETGDSIRYYVVRPGDTLSRIATQELGSISMADNIYLLNRDLIFDPDQLVIGTRIRLPMRESLAAAPGARPGPGPGAAVTNPPPAAPVSPAVAEGGRAYRVRPGDTLSSIALQFYGSSSGWRFLYESNRTAISNPNQLSVGAELVIPPYGEKQ